MRMFALVFATVLWASGTPAQTIGIFADTLGMNCNLEIAFPGDPAIVYAVASLDAVASEGVVAAAFRVDGLPTGWSAIVTPGPQVVAMLGNPFAEGAVVAYQSCMLGPRLLLWSAVVTPSSPVQNVQLQVTPHSQYGDTCYFTHDCGRSCVHFCDCTGIPQCICAEGLRSHINGAPCIVGVTQAGWGQCKLLYR